jgi:uncharacterized iron-regulated protein
MKKIISIAFLALLSRSFAQKEHAFIIYNSKGKQTTFKALAKQAEVHQIVFFGEYHDNPISHWLEYELTTKLYEKHNKNLVLGFEMFEQDQQNLLNEYLRSELTEKHFEDSCRLWPNYETDYKPIIDFSKEKGLNCIASNVQRKYASLLYKKGRRSLDTLSNAIKTQMADLNFILDTSLSQYQEIKQMGGHAMGLNMVESQAFKDATMAKFILENLQNYTHVIHFNGAFHSDFHQGIIWYLEHDKQKAVPSKQIMTISTVSQRDIRKLDNEHLGRADFIICVPESMTKTH